MKIQAISQTIRSILLQKLKTDLTGYSSVAVSLSGGIDSAILAALCLDLGKSVTAYTFRFPWVDSSDWKRSQIVAKKLGISHKEVQLPLPSEAIVETLARIGCRKKTDFECFFPVLFLFQEIQERVIINGNSADGYFGTSKKVMIHYRRPLKKFQSYREELFANPGYAQRGLIEAYADKIGKLICMPFFSEELGQLLFPLDWDFLNFPRNKEPLRLLGDLYGLKTISRHQNLQLGDSEIAESFASLAKGLGFRSPVGFYNSIIKKIEKP